MLRQQKHHAILVHCRTGSLEKKENPRYRVGLVHCRTGSLEIKLTLFTDFLIVHCRTGSLEITEKRIQSVIFVHCRTGSLEMILVPDFVNGGVHCCTAYLIRVPIVVLQIRVGFFVRLVKHHTSDGGVRIESNCTDVESSTSYPLTLGLVFHN